MVGNGHGRGFVPVGQRGVRSAMTIGRVLGCERGMRGRRCEIIHGLGLAFAEQPRASALHLLVGQQAGLIVIPRDTFIGCD